MTKTESTHWNGFIKCDICDDKLKFEDRKCYNDLQVCEKCKNIIVEKLKGPKHPLEDEMEYKKQLKEKQKRKKK